MENLTFDQLPAAVSKLLEIVSKLEVQLQNQKKQSPNTDNWFDLNELCLYLPDKPAKPTVYAYVQHRIIPFHKKGKKLFFLRSEIDAWLKAGRRRTSSEIAAEVNNYFTAKN